MKLQFSIPLVVAVAMALSACSPQFNWRDYRAADAPYSVMFPGKPASHTRTVTLEGRQAAMTMTAAEVEGTMFAVGTTELADAAQAKDIARSMQAAMVRNIAGTISKETPHADGVELEAHGASNGRPMQLHGKFLSRGKRAYQVVVIGPERAVDAENIDTFIRSFKLN